MSVIRHSPQKFRALVVIPGVVNYFYNLAGRRIAETLRSLNFDVDIREPKPGAEDDSRWDACFLCNIPEILEGHENHERGMDALRDLRARSRRVYSLSIDCVETPWFKRLSELSLQAQADSILDLGLVPQRPPAAAAQGPSYRFLFSGLTPSERRSLDELDHEDEDRPLPWAFVGHITEARASLVDQLIQAVHPGGFIYVPKLAPYTETGSPHLNQQQFEAVLQRARYQVWCSHHEHFYMEPERFRTSLLTGGVPIKVIERGRSHPDQTPFDYLLIPKSDLGRLAIENYPRLLRRFRDDWRGLPTLRDGLGAVLAESDDERSGSETRLAGTAKSGRGAGPHHWFGRGRKSKEAAASRR